MEIPLTPEQSEFFRALNKQVQTMQAGLTRLGASFEGAVSILMATHGILSAKRAIVSDDCTTLTIEPNPAVMEIRGQLATSLKQ